MPHLPMPDRRATPEKVLRARELRSQMTAAERQLWFHLRADRLCGLHFRRQQIIAGFIVDFYCHQTALVIEVDGGIHAEQIEADAERDLILAGHGLTVMRVTNDEVLRNIESVLDRIATACGRPRSRRPNC